MNMGTMGSDWSEDTGTGDSWTGFSLPSFSDFSMFDTSSTPAPASVPSAGGNTNSWFTDLLKTGVGAYTQIATLDAKADIAQQQMQMQMQQQQLAQRNSLMYPYGTNTGLNSSLFNTGGLSPFPASGGMGSGLSMTAIIGLGGLAIALLTFMKKD